MGKEIGIDFGTTTTEVSYIDKKGRSRSMRLDAGKAVIPTVLYFESEDDYFIGPAANFKGCRNPDACVKNFNLSLADSSKKYPVKAENGDEFFINPVQAVRHFLNRLIRDVVQPKLLMEFGERDGMIDKAVIAVPAQFDPKEKDIIKDVMETAVKQAGFSQIQAVTKSCAAAVAHQAEHGKSGETILAYHFGAETFDVSVIRRKDDIYTELATDGDKLLGDNLLTEKIAKVLWDKCLKETGKDYPFDEEEAKRYFAEKAKERAFFFSNLFRNRAEIFRAAEEMKLDFTENQSSSQSVAFYTDDGNHPRPIVLHMDEPEFYGIIRADIQKTVDLTRRVLEEVKRRGDINAVDEVALAGGGSQIRLIRELLEEYDDFKGLVTVSPDASALVARGAALIASKNLKIREKTRFEIGARVMEGESLDASGPLTSAGERPPRHDSRLRYPARDGQQEARDGQQEISPEYYEKDIADRQCTGGVSAGGLTMGKEIGIDFGTTTTEVSYIDKKGRSRSMRLDAGKAVIPTVLYFKSENDYVIGQSAAVRGAANPEACVRNFKLSLTDSSKKYRVKAENGDKFSIKPIKAAQFFLNQLIQTVQPKLLREFGETGGTIDKAVITVPAQFDPKEKGAIKDAIEKAAKQAGFSQIKVATEPSAAAVAHQEENGENGKTILVYDFGGGTFDVSVIRRKDDIYTELATNGDKTLGGNRLTEKIAKVLWGKCLKETGKDYPFEAEEAERYSEEEAEEYALSRTRFILNRTEIFRAAEEMKLDFTENQSSSQSVRFYTDDENDPRLIELHMDEPEFYGIVKADVKKTVDLTRRVMEEVKRRGDVDAVDEVALAGGSSQIRLIRELLEEYDDLKGLVRASADASTLISRGAALLASKELKTEEKTRFEIGTRVMKGKSLNAFEPWIPMGESLPCKGSRIYYPARDGQREISIEYYEKDIKNYPDATRIDDEGMNLVDELTVSGLPDVPGLAVKVTFQIDLDGTPAVKAEVVDHEGNVVQSSQLLVNRKGNLY